VKKLLKILPIQKFDITLQNLSASKFWSTSPSAVKRKQREHWKS